MDVEAFSELGAGRFPGYLGIRIAEVGGGRARCELEIETHHLAPNGYLHAGAVVGLADTVCGYGCFASLPDGANGFTTAGISLWPRKMVVTAENDSIFDTPSSFWKIVPSTITIQRMMPR